MSGRARLLAAVVPLLALAACGGGKATSTSTAGPPAPPFPVVRRAPHLVAPWVSTRGGRFVDATGHTVLLRGVDVTLTPPPDYSQAVALHANFVRIVAPWSLFEPTAPTGSTHHWDAATLRQLDAEVAYFEQHRVNVLIDFHQFHWSPYFAGHHCRQSGKCTARGIPAWYYADGRFPDSGRGERAAEQAFWTTEARSSQAAYAAFAAMIATRYARYPNVVGYEIFNEPHPGNLGDTTAATDAMLGWQVRIRNVLRTVDPTRTVFVMCRGGGEGVGTANLALFGSLDHLAL
ncbi:MAG TPA: cellulase family glycosylhydrolase, partial [Gaiellales bacterium]|nr:cellulase family glycosylhydrolase [Gaiellales bacterium]